MLLPYRGMTRYNEKILRHKNKNGISAILGIKEHSVIQGEKKQP